MYIYDFEIRVEYVDTDKMGIMHNSRYFLFFERGRTETMRSLGIGYKKIENKGVTMPVVEQFARYLLPAFYDDILVVRTKITEMPMAKIRFDYEIIRNENGTENLLCVGYNTLAFVDTATNKPLRLPQWIKDSLKPYMD
ncbi:MAG: acyl-CoA thioesterase [Bacteroidales bacterium]|jgi:acyl-CoA thioester hydrolase|nr:acyl-CoA thioesterase [Bacteroidales bacterium]